MKNKETKKREWKLEDFYYEPWHSSMDKKLTKKQQEALDKKIDDCIAYILADTVDDEEEEDEDEK